MFSDEEEEKPKKEVVPLVFKNKKEAMEAFKSLLKEKVRPPPPFFFLRSPWKSGKATLVQLSYLIAAQLLNCLTKTSGAEL